MRIPKMKNDKAVAADTCKVCGGPAHVSVGGKPIPFCTADVEAAAIDMIREEAAADDKALRVAKADTESTTATTTKKEIRKMPKIAPRRKVHAPDTIAVPDKRFATEYIGRKIAGVDDFDIFDLAVANRENVLLEGPTGSAKTSSVLAWAALRGAYFYSVSSNGAIEPSQLFGKKDVKPDGTIDFIDGGVTALMRMSQTGALCVITLDELNFFPSRISTVLFQLLDKRREITLMDNRGEVVRAGDNLLIVATMNPDYAGTRPLNAALRNRFSIILDWDYLGNVEAKLVRSKSLRSMAKKFRSEAARGGFDTPVSTNMLQEFERHFDQRGWEWAKYLFVNHFMAHERTAATGVVDTYQSNISDELDPQRAAAKAEADAKAAKAEAEAAAKAAAGGDDDSEFEDAQDISDEKLSEISAKKWAHGDVDPELGVFGVDWFIEFD